jgi:KipI family sensor histidine kinase inhibitor
VTISLASDRSLLIEFGAEISPEIHEQVLRATRAVAGLRGVMNLHPAYASLLVDFDPRRVTAERLEAQAREAMDRAARAPLPRARTVEIPVCYGGECGPDLEDVARHHGISPQRVVELHAGAEYLVYFLGFSPGFPYLGGLPAELATPRLDTPRKLVPAGSVAIGGAQTGVYPQASPGGWRLIGRTPARLFQPEQAAPTLLCMGDRVRFRPIRKEDW